MTEGKPFAMLQRTIPLITQDKRTSLRAFRFIFFFVFIIFVSHLALSEENSKEVIVITVNGVINPVAAEYVARNIEKANEKNAEALIIELDTPGGLDTSMRDIVKNIIASKVPVVVFVSPSGSRAG